MRPTIALKCQLVLLPRDVRLGPMEPAAIPGRSTSRAEHPTAKAQGDCDAYPASPHGVPLGERPRLTGVGHGVAPRPPTVIDRAEDISSETAAIASASGPTVGSRQEPAYGVAVHVGQAEVASL